MFAYRTGPIDSWLGWMTEAQFEKQVRAESIDEINPHSLSYFAVAMHDYCSFRDEAFELAKKVGWEGDIRLNSGPYIAGLPAHQLGADDHFMIAWKQDNNGETFVVSPYRLPWLENDEYGQWVEVVED